MNKKNLAVGIGAGFVIGIVVIAAIAWVTIPPKTETNSESKGAPLDDNINLLFLSLKFNGIQSAVRNHNTASAAFLNNEIPSDEFLQQARQYAEKLDTEEQALMNDKSIAQNHIPLRDKIIEYIDTLKDANNEFINFAETGNISYLENANSQVEDAKKMQEFILKMVNAEEKRLGIK